MLIMLYVDDVVVVVVVVLVLSNWVEQRAFELWCLQWVKSSTDIPASKKIIELVSFGARSICRGE